MIQILKPCRGRITQWFANIQSHDGRKHTGNDYGYYTDGAVTDEVFAAADGVVQFAGDSRTLGWPNRWYINPDFDRSDAQDSSAGNFIAIAHTQGGARFDTTYSHLAAWTVKAGDVVKADQRIATIGATGFSAGKHLHFELLLHPFNFGTDTYGRSDPNPYIRSGGIAAMGTTTATTSSQEEDMPLSGEDHQFILEAIDDYFKNVRPFEGNRNIIDAMQQTRTDVISVKESVAALPQAVLIDFRVEGRNVFDSLNQVRTDLFGTRGAVDVEALAKSLSEQLAAADVAALAAQITVRGK